MTTQLHFPAGLDVEGFLGGHWQRRPLLLPGGFPDFASPIDPEALAGLACEPDVEARLILERDGAYPWEVRHGPFDDADFADLPETHWTLLVQDVDKHLAEVGELLGAFRFLPDWRLDDIMISWAADGGSVGPHIDEYDVFLIQARGQRRWRIDPRPQTDAACIPGLDLRILADFSPTQEHLLGPGDVLYLPPGVPHWGVAEGPCMTWSVGLRAPAWRELASAWGDFAAERLLPAGRYRDAVLSPQTSSAEIRPEVFAQVREILHAGLCGPHGELFREWLGRFLTEPKENLQALPAAEPLDAEALARALRAGACLERNGFCRLAWSRGDDGPDLLFAAGMAYRLDPRHRGLLMLLAGQARIGRAELGPWLDHPECADLLARLYNDGHYDFCD